MPENNRVIQSFTVLVISLIQEYFKIKNMEITAWGTNSTLIKGANYQLTILEATYENNDLVFVEKSLKSSRILHKFLIKKADDKIVIVMENKEKGEIISTRYSNPNDALTNGFSNQNTFVDKQSNNLALNKILEQIRNLSSMYFSKDVNKTMLCDRLMALLSKISGSDKKVEGINPQLIAHYEELKENDMASTFNPWYLAKLYKKVVNAEGEDFSLLIGNYTTKENRVMSFFILVREEALTTFVRAYGLTPNKYSQAVIKKLVEKLVSMNEAFLFYNDELDSSIPEIIKSVSHTTIRSPFNSVYLTLPTNATRMVKAWNLIIADVSIHGSDISDIDGFMQRNNLPNGKKVLPHKNSN